jgi:hypothetical protein
MGTYSTDVTPTTTDADGNLTSFSSAGVNLRAGGSGVRHGKNSTLSGDLFAGYRYYTRDLARNSDGFDAGGSLGYSRQISYRTAFQFGLRGQTYGYSWSGAYTPSVEIPIEGVTDPALGGFDTRTNSFGATAGLSHALNRRWSFSFIGSGYYTDRESKALVSSRGWRGGTAINYAISENASTGFGYNYSSFYSPGGYGDTRTHIAYWSIGKRFENRWSLSANLGAYYAEFDRVVSVPLDPVLAAIIGRPTVLEPFFDNRTGPSIAVTASRAFQRSGLSLFYRRGITPGTGFYASGEEDTAGIQYTVTTSRKTNVGFGARYSRSDSLGTDQTYQNYGANVGFNYRIGKGLNFSCSASYYFQDVTQGNFNRSRVLVTAGISYGSGPLPLSLF